MRPSLCDGDDCDRDERGVWRHLPGCMAIADDGEDDHRPEGWIGAYLDGLGYRPRRGAGAGVA